MLITDAQGGFTGSKDPGSGAGQRNESADWRQIAHCRSDSRAILERIEVFEILPQAFQCFSQVVDTMIGREHR